ncbi:MAG: hypothetical protein V4613_12190 [Bacteroidota bacterium]
MMKLVFTYLLLIFTIKAGAQPLNATSYISGTPFKGLEQLDSVVNNYTIFFTGENHNYKKENANIQLRMLAYLNKQANVRNYILELGYARGYMLNAYINNDTTYYASLKATTSKSYLELYKALKKMNDELPENKKIAVQGVDVERFPDDGPMLLASLIPKNTEIPEAIAFDVEVLKSYANYSSVKYDSYTTYESTYTIGSNSFYSYGFNNAETIDSIVESYKLKKPYYMELLKDKFALFDKIFQSIMEYRKWTNYAQLPHQTIYRERMIYDNIAKQITEHPDEKFYGQFGRCHTSLSLINKDCNWYEVKPTAMRLNEGIGKGKTMTIGIFYNEDKTDTYEDFATTEILKKYIDIPCTNENVLMSINREDTLLSQHFSYILANSICSKDKTKYTKKSNYDYDDYHEWAVALDFGYGQSFFNFDKLNKDLKFTDKGFKQPVQQFSIGYTYMDFGNYNFGRYEQHLTQKTTLNGLNYTLSGYSAMEGYGYSPHISKHFTIGAYGILGFQRFSMMIENDSAAYSPSPGFSPIKRYKYINNAVSVGIGLDLRLAFSPSLGIFVRGRYLADISRKYWRNTMGSYGILDSNSPPTSLANYSLQAGLSILIQE